MTYWLLVFLADLLLCIFWAGERIGYELELFGSYCKSLAASVGERYIQLLYRPCSI